MAGTCEAAPIYFNGNFADVAGDVQVKSGTGCSFGLDGIRGAINEAVITRPAKVGRVGVRGLSPYYIAKPGYQGRDEFTYVFNGIDAYGGPMKVTITRRITVVP